jgi:hypothetical protein
VHLGDLHDLHILVCDAPLPSEKRQASRYRSAR